MKNFDAKMYRFPRSNGKVTSIVCSPLSLSEACWKLADRINGGKFCFLDQFLSLSQNLNLTLRQAASYFGRLSIRKGPNMLVRIKSVQILFIKSTNQKYLR